MTINTFKMMLRYLWMPGNDIFTRRRVRLEKHWRQGERQVLDAGCGNGWFAYRAYRSGARVTGVAIQSALIDKARNFYHDFLAISPDRLRFVFMNLYDLPSLAGNFDEIVCYETLEHIKDDRRVCANFFAALKPGGVLHLCCPNAQHPRWRDEVLDQDERGGHVRCGYTESEYRQLLEPLGFHIETVEGVGGGLLIYLQEQVQSVARHWFGEAGAMIVTMLSLPFVWLDRPNPPLPFSLYVRAVRPAGPGSVSERGR
jgi:SAM-dependent methyltransferase